MICLQAIAQGESRGATPIQHQSSSGSRAVVARPTGSLHRYYQEQSRLRQETIVDADEESLFEPQLDSLHEPTGSDHTLASNSAESPFRDETPAVLNAPPEATDGAELQDPDTYAALSPATTTGAP